MSFWGSLFGGQNSTLDKNLNNFGQIGGFATGLGENNLSQSSNFFSSILSGDPSKTAKVLAPQISGIQQQNQQNKNQTAQFGNRSGGNNAAMQMGNDKARSSVNDMVSSLMGTSASNLQSSGSSLLGQGMSAYNAQDQVSQQQMQNWSNSILGRGINTAISAAESYGMGAAGGALPGGPGAAAGGQGALGSFLG